MPVCTGRCGLEKPVEEFHKDSTQASGRSSRCKECRCADKQEQRNRRRAGVVVPLDKFPSARAVLESPEGEAAAVFAEPVPPGFHVKGVSTLFGADGSVRGQWLKSNKDAEDERAALLEYAAGIAEQYRGTVEPVPLRGPTRSDLLNVVPIGDPHFGMLSWATETGQAFDLEIAERNLIAGVDHLMAGAPRASKCLLIFLGDNTHANGGSATTTKGTRVDVDSRHPKVLRTTARAFRRAFDRARETHDEVYGRIEIGNHDSDVAVALALILEAMFENEPRVHIDVSPSKFYYHRFGKCLIASTHSDTVKPEQLLGVMACDRPTDWGETIHRRFYRGHVHHDSVKELPGLTVESVRTLAPSDAWHKGQGYRSGQDLKLDTWHSEWGLIGRSTVSIHQIAALLGNLEAA